MSKLLEFVRNNFAVFAFSSLLLGVGVGVFVSGFRTSSECSVPIEIPTLSESIVVDISGAVEKPGLYKVPSTTRVGEAIDLAGGISRNASVEWLVKNINFAEGLEDSQKIYIPFEWDSYENSKVSLSAVVKKSSVSTSASSGSSAGSNTVGTTLNVNTATLEELDELPGVGPVYAQKIISNRNYQSYEEFLEKSGLTPATAEKIKNLISF